MDLFKHTTDMPVICFTRALYCVMVSELLDRWYHEMNKKQHDPPPNRTSGRIHLNRSVQTKGEDILLLPSETCALLDPPKERKADDSVRKYDGSLKFLHVGPRIGGHVLTAS